MFPWQNTAVFVKVLLESDKLFLVSHSMARDLEAHVSRGSSASISLAITKLN
jgi:hypothetical protein